jgi:predicted O-methyltransferase YrrM
MNIFENLNLEQNTHGMTPQQVKELGTLLPCGDTINVLEFGAGNTTLKLFDALKTRYKNVRYVTYETDERWAPKNSEIETRMFTISELEMSLLKISENEKYDLIIVDGPDGEYRKYWYRIFKNNIKSGSIIHIDDICHYESFEIEFIKNFPNANNMFLVSIENTNKCWSTFIIK